MDMKLVTKTITTVASLLILATSMQAKVLKHYPTQEFLNKKIPIVDVRTPPEWKQTGIIKGSIPILFFNEQEKYDVKEFITELNKRVDTSKPFAILCRTGRRTALIADFLSKEFGYTVIDLVGGIQEAKLHNLPIVPYNKPK